MCPSDRERGTKGSKVMVELDKGLNEGGGDLAHLMHWGQGFEVARMPEDEDLGQDLDEEKPPLQDH